MSTISFAKVPGAGSSEPATAPVPDAKAELVPPVDGSPAAAGSTAVVPRQSSAPTPSGFYSGEEDDIPTDRGDVKMPRLNIVQGLSGPELKAIGPDGTLVLKKQFALPQPARIVVCGCSRKRYAEKLAQYGKGEARLFDTLEEVVNSGGTDQWRQSRDNKDADGNSVSKKPWFQPMVTALLLIELPTKAAFDAQALLQKKAPLTDDDYAALTEHFSATTSDGKLFSPCAYTVKSTSFGSFYIPIKTEQTTGVLRHGFFTRYIGVTTRQVRAFEPVVTILEPTPESVRELAKTMLA